MRDEFFTLISTVANLFAKLYRKVFQKFVPNSSSDQEWRELKTIEDNKAKRCVVFSVGAHHCYRFEEYLWLAPWEEDGEYLDEGYWTSTQISGLYGTADEAEADARSTISWLKAQE